MTQDQAVARQAAHENLVRELAEALETAINIIEGLDGRDNSCDPKMDLSDLRTAVAKVRNQ